MKRTAFWKRPVLLGCALALTPLAPVLAQDQSKASATEKKMLDAASQKLDYVKRLIELDEQQIALGNLALQKSNETRVRGLAQNLVTAHTQHLDELSKWARAREQEIRSVSGVGGGGTAGTATQAGKAPAAPVSEGGMGSVASALDTYAQRADQHRATLSKDYADLQKESGNSFDRKWLDAVAETQKKGDDLVKDGIDKYMSDVTFAMLLKQTDQLLQSNLRAAKQIGPGLE